MTSDQTNYTPSLPAPISLSPSSLKPSPRNCHNIDSPALSSFVGGHESVNSIQYPCDGLYAVQHCEPTTTTWETIIVKHAIESPSDDQKSPPQLVQQQQQPTKHLSNLSGASVAHEIDSSNQDQQQQRYNFQYQDEVSRMRERLFRLLSKVPIHVETEPTNCQPLEGDSGDSSNVSSADAASSSHQQQQRIKSRQASQCKISRESLIIKYYKDKTLSELIEQHFGCALVKHNYDRREPLVDHFSCVQSVDNKTHIALPQAPPYSSLRRLEKGKIPYLPQDFINSSKYVPTNHNQDNSGYGQAWTPTVSMLNHSSSSSSPSCSSATSGGLSNNNQPVTSWHHLSVDNLAWKRNNQRPECKRNACSSAPKARSPAHHHQARATAANPTTKIPRKPSTGACEQRFVGVANDVADGRQTARILYHHAEPEPEYWQRLKLELGANDQQQNRSYHQFAHNQQLNGARQQQQHSQITFFPLPGATQQPQQQQDALSDATASFQQPNYAHFDSTSYPQPQAIVGPSSDAGAPVIHEHALLSTSGQAPAGANNCLSPALYGSASHQENHWPCGAAENQLLADMMQQHQYTDAYYPTSQIANQQPVPQLPVMPSVVVDGWHIQHHQLQLAAEDSAAGAEQRMIDHNQGQQQLTTETTSHDNDSYDCIHTAAPGAPPTPIALYLHPSAQLSNPSNETSLYLNGQQDQRQAHSLACMQPIPTRPSI